MAYEGIYSCDRCGSRIECLSDLMRLKVILRPWSRNDDDHEFINQDVCKWCAESLGFDALTEKWAALDRAEMETATWNASEETKAAPDALRIELDALRNEILDRITESLRAMKVAPEG